MISNEPSSIVQAEVNIPVMAIHVESLAPTPGETQIEIVSARDWGAPIPSAISSWSGFHKRYPGKDFVMKNNYAAGANFKEV